MDVEPGTVVLYTDVVCGWATVALHRFYRERERAGLTDAVRVEHRLFSLEDVDRRPVPKPLVDGELATLGALEPDIGWTPWQQDPSWWPGTSLPANEAVHAAKLQSLAAAEELDMAIRLAFFRDSRPIHLVYELYEIAATCRHVDVDALAENLDEGTARATMMRDYRTRGDRVQGSPHFFLADGSDVHNPGVELHWAGAPGEGFPVVDSDDPTVTSDLVRRAAGR
ncbi:DsbA family protein [Prescottella sp. R16]|uniref:DsbA family oxidoreductase n=1 Tax=Prescottella sp. R16 TaxID=3064529 RepID=UPI00272ECD0A|nr:DsbA family protein [Prescottella sp. R16]